MSEDKSPLDGIDRATRTEIEAAAFRHLVGHLQDRTDVQNIDLMNLAGFCRNCLSKWYRAAAEKRDISLELDDVREWVYGQPYDEWKKTHQTGPKKELTPEAAKAAKTIPREA